MGDIPDNRPVFTILMGCDGSGKTAWKRANREALPTKYIDMESIADGLGDWDDDVPRAEALEIAEGKIESALADRQSYGIESTFSGVRGVNQLLEAKKNNFRLLGYYFGTTDPKINIERIEKRVRLQLGLRVDPTLIPRRWGHSLSNLRKHAADFAELVIFDNSLEYDLRFEDPKQLVFFEYGRPTNLIVKADRPEWFKAWFSSWEARQESLERFEWKRKTGEAHNPDE